MKDPRFYILVAIPLVGILANTGLFIRLSGTMNMRFAALESKVDSGSSEWTGDWMRCWESTRERQLPHPCRGPDGDEAVARRASTFVPLRVRFASFAEGP